MVKWSLPAKSSLKNIFDFITIDSKFYASKVITEIIKKTEVLDEFPEIGRVMPEFNESSIREVRAFTYRIVYEIKNDTVYILNIIHGRRVVTVKMIEDSE